MIPLSKLQKDFMNDTISCTPQPAACSTIEKQKRSRKLQLDKIPLSFNPDNSSASVSSLKILNVDNLPMESCLDAKPETSTRISETRQRQRALANQVLRKSISNGLPSRFLNPSETIQNYQSISNLENNSTVNESDLLQGSKNCDEEKISFTPADISTPRSSDALFESPIFNQRNSMTAEANNLSQLYDENNSSDIINLTDLCNKFQKLASLGLSKLNVSNESFVSGDFAEAKLEECERSWQNNRGIIGNTNPKTDSMFSGLENEEGATSITDFFRKKSELADICFKTSPERRHAPTPLIDESSCTELSNSRGYSSDSSLLSSNFVNASTLSTSEIERVISATDNTTKIVDYMLEKATTKKSTGKFSNHELTERNANKENLTKFQNKKSLPKPQLNQSEFILKDSQNIPETAESSLDKSLTSTRTTSSLDTLPGGKLPIESTRTELIWGCVQVGKRQIQTFVLRNKCQSKLRMQISSSSTNFKILNDHSESDAVSVLPILLHPSESRLFSVMFTPSNIGGMVEKLKFTPIVNELQRQQTRRQQVLLYGYGGHGNVEIQDVPKDTNMRMWLSLGKLDSTLQLNKKFRIRNTGVLSAFACLSFNSKALYSSSKITIYPTEIVLKPKEEVQVTISYIPTKDDAKHVFAATNNEIIEIGTIQFISGEEALRGRIRRLSKHLNRSSMTDNNLIERLSKKFINEQFPSDLQNFSETVGCMKELIQNLVSREIVITIEKDLEHTLLGHIAEMEDTTMFQSLCEGMSTMMVPRGQKSCVVEPTQLVLTPPIKTADTVLITNHSTNTLQFEVATKPSGILSVTPTQGLVSANETIILQITCDVTKVQQPKQMLQMLVYLDDDVFEIDVKIILVKPQLFK